MLISVFYSDRRRLQKVLPFPKWPGRLVATHVEYLPLEASMSGSEDYRARSQQDFLFWELVSTGQKRLTKRSPPRFERFDPLRIKQEILGKHTLDDRIIYNVSSLVKERT